MGGKYWLLRWNGKGKLQRSQRCLPRILNHGIIRKVCQKVTTLPMSLPVACGPEHTDGITSDVRGTGPSSLVGSSPSP